MATKDPQLGRAITIPWSTAGKLAPQGDIEGVLLRPDATRAFLVFGHGAGAGMRHEFMEDMARRLAEVGIATLRYEFPYMSQGRRRIDAEAVLLATVGAALAAASELAGGLPIFAGGKSMGGRMTSRYLAATFASAVRGLIFFGFPLHPAKKPATSRAEHLGSVQLPMLFMQGTRDDLADLVLMRGVVGDLASRARLHVVDGADHSFAVLKRSGRTGEDVREELVREAARFCEAVLLDQR